MRKIVMMDRERYNDVMTQAIFDMPRIMEDSSPKHWYVWDKKIPMKEYIDELINSKDTSYKWLDDLQSAFLNRLEDIYEIEEERSAFDVLFGIDPLQHPEHYDYIVECNTRIVVINTMNEIKNVKQKIVLWMPGLNKEYIRLIENVVFYMLNLGVWRWYCWDDLIKWFNIDDEEW